MPTLDRELIARRNEIYDAISRDTASEFDGVFDSLTEKPTSLAGYGIADAQPLDADLTAIAGLVTHSFGRELLTKSDEAAIRSYIGAGSSSFDGAFASLSGKPTTVAGYGITDFNSLGDARWSLLAHAHAFASITSTPTTLAGYGISDAFTQTAADLLYAALVHSHTFANLTSKPTTIAGYGITDLNSLGDARWQTLDSDLTTWASLSPSANAQSLVTAADYAAMRGLLDLQAGTDFYSISAANAAFQSLDADLTTLAGLTATTDNFIVSVASSWASRTPAQVRTTLGLVIGTNVQAFDADLTTWAAITPASGAGTFLATPTLVNLSALVSDANIARIDAAQTFVGLQTFPTLQATSIGIGVAPTTCLLELNTGGSGSVNSARFLVPAISSGGDTDFYLGKAAASYQSVAFGYHYSSTAANAYGYFTNYGDSSTAGISVTSGGKTGIGGANTGTGTLYLNGSFGINVLSPSAFLHVISTTVPMRVGYDASNYWDVAIGSTGGVTFDAVGAGAGFTFNDKVINASTLRLKGYTVATLPAGTQGDTAFVTDALAPAFLVAVAGGGAIVTTVFYNGVTWVAQ